MRVYVIRHGESENNLSGKWTGWLDARLTDKGKEDAKRARDFLKGTSFDKVFASDLSRAVETAQIALPSYKCEVSPLFREIDVGALSNQPLSVVTDSQRERIVKHGYVDFDGESKEAFSGRICQAMKMLETLSCENIAVFSHGGWMRGMLDAVTGVYHPRKNVRCTNCAVAIFDYNGSLWQLHSWINLP